LNVGVEIEYGLLTPSLEPVSESQRDSVNRRALELYGGAKLFDYELGASQLELRTPTPPGDVLGDGLAGLLERVGSIEQALRSAVAEHDLRLLRCGANPFVDVAKIERTSTKKYETVPNFHDRYKRFPEGSRDTMIGERQPVDVKGADIISLTNAVQFIVDCRSCDDAIDKLNRSLMIGPFLVAACGNARFLNGADTELADLRMIAWEISHDVRNAAEVLERAPQRVGLPGAYFIDLRDYFERVASYPFILHPDTPEDAFAVGLGIFWLDARVKFNFTSKRAILEFRPLSTQPSLQEDMGALAFYLGRLAWSQESGEQLLDLGLVRENRYAAMRHGLDATLWSVDDGRPKRDPARVVVPREIRRAQCGLESLHLWDETSKNLLARLEDRLTQGTPSDRFALSVSRHQEKGLADQEAIARAISDLGMIVS
jgi:gamma-glutamyl:cysteine ligase YbdK (ATP-grasp superfamily)